MQQINLLTGVIFALILAYVGLSLFQLETAGGYIRPFILPVVLLYYCKTGNRKSGYFFYFLLLYAIGDVLGLIYNYPEINYTLDDILYYSCNSFYVAAYISLIGYILETIPLRKVLRKYMLHIAILLALDIYCVILVTDVAIQSEFLVSVYDYILEFVYNAVIMLLLTVTLVNYLYRDAPKSMNLLIGALCVVFSETIQVAYFYVSEVFVLGMAYIVLIIMAFFFFVLQTKMEYSNSPTIEANQNTPVNGLKA